MRPRRRAVAVIASVFVALGAVVFVLARLSADAGPRWACAPDRRAVDIPQLAAGGGYAHPKEALYSAADLLSGDDGAAPKAPLYAEIDAIDPDSLSAGDVVDLHVDGEVVAEVPLVRLTDGTGP